jgi:bacillithiol system protein YtxJ
MSHLNNKKMNWNPLKSSNDLIQIDEESKSHPVLILKHSTTCSISAMALSRLERKWQKSDNEILKPYYLDLLRHRELSNEIATRYGVVHESPQVLIIRNGSCVYNSSHMDITYDAIMAMTAA